MLAVGGLLLFRGKAFCAHICPVGRINGIYANFAPVEVRAYKLGACKTCETEDCLNGNERGYPCPTGISLKTTTDASRCTFCTECVKSCPRQNVAFNLRPFGADLREVERPRLDEAWLALALLSLTLFHGLSMTTVWESHLPGAPSLLKWLQVSGGLGHTAAFTAAMAVMVALPIGLYALSAKVAERLTRGSGVSFRTLFVRYAYALLPVALFYHLAHNAMHLFKEGAHLVPMLSDPLGRGSDLIGTRDLVVGPLLSDGSLWYLQVGLIIIGHVAGVIVAHRLSRRLFPEPAVATRSLLPMLAVMLLISAGGLSLMLLDMNMRMGRM